MNKKIIMIIAVSLAVLLIGVAVVLAVQNRNDTVKGDGTLKDTSDKESISSEADGSEITKITYSEADETEKTSVETTQTEKETKPSAEDPSQTEASSKKSTTTKATTTKLTTAKATTTKVTTTKFTTTKLTTTKLTTTKATTTKLTTTKATTTKATTTKATTTKATTTKATTTKPTEPERNEPIAANFTVFDGNGNEVHLSDYAGKPIILNFWASWCGPCKREMPDFNKKYLEYGDKIQFLMVDYAIGDNIENAKKYISEMGYEFPVYFDMDGNASAVYGIQAFPTTVFIDADGYVVQRFQGTISEEKLQSGIDKILE